MLPARQGDCIWIEYSAGNATHHLVIDGGPEHAGALTHEVARRLRASDEGGLHIDLLVVTHIDNDHIGGVVDLIEGLPAGLSFGDIWFNGFRHLVPTDRLGTAQADRLSDALAASGLPWNEAFDHGPVTIPAQGALPRIRRQGVLDLTLLGPGEDALVRLAREWDEDVRQGRTEPHRATPSDFMGRKDKWPPDVDALLKERFEADAGAPNGSSIALLLGYCGRQILLSADAPADPLAESIRRLLAQSGGMERLALDACKVSHHGSKKSTSCDLLGLLRCNHWLISTDGSYFGHPDSAAIARLITHGGPKPELIFNSRKEFSSRWERANPSNRAKFSVRLPTEEGSPVTMNFPV
ncbi:MAG: MBL fold metallo-hydrolase [Alphaproteobacteria bacterium]|nr:MBL fold metallo-hydrolase [Alphaproteobacteria bacterium]